MSFCKSYIECIIIYCQRIRRNLINKFKIVYNLNNIKFRIKRGKCVDINKLIEEGESTTIEFKSWKNARSKKDLISVITKEAVALANTKGGVILIGVEDEKNNKEITGCTDYDAQAIIESIYDRTIPKLFTEIEEVKVNDKIVLVLKVEKSNNVISTSAGETFKRLGKNSKPMFAENFPSNIFGKTNDDFSNIIIEDSSLDDINLMEVYKLKERLKVREPESTLTLLDDLAFLRDLHLIKEFNGEDKLTVAGLLFVGKDEAIRRSIPQAEVIYLHYSDKNKIEYDKRLDLRTGIISILDRLTEVIEDKNYITNIQVGLFRLEVKDFPTNVFQEALLNAISHRDYRSNASIYVKHYSDKIVIENPGTFPEGITEKNIITHPSVPRNKLICETLQRLKYVQRSGQGVDIIFKDMISLGKATPTYEVYEEAIRLTLTSQLEDEVFVKFIVEEQENNNEIFSLSETIILKYLKENKNVKINKIKEITQLGTLEAKNVLKELINKKLIEISSRDYMLTQIAYEKMGDSIGYTKDKSIDHIRATDMIKEYIKDNGYITKSIIMDLCSFTEDKAKYIIRKLTQREVILKEGTGKATKYVINKK